MFRAKKGGSDVSAPKSSSGPLPLTLDNVELVLDDMRPYLMADGGNVAVVDIEGGIVKLELQGACGSCPSSTMTMKMGLERGLLEKIPEIVAVEQVQPEGPQLTQEGIEGKEGKRHVRVVGLCALFVPLSARLVELPSMLMSGFLSNRCLRKIGRSYSSRG